VHAIRDPTLTEKEKQMKERQWKRDSLPLSFLPVRIIEKFSTKKLLLGWTSRKTVAIFPSYNSLEAHHNGHTWILTMTVQAIREPTLMEK
jgi:hypothetical protein